MTRCTLPILKAVAMGFALWAIFHISAPASRMMWRDLVAPAAIGAATERPDRIGAGITSLEARSLSRRHGAGSRCHGNLGPRAVCMLA